MKIFKTLLALYFIIFTLNSSSEEKIYSFENPMQQEIFQNLLEELRCLVCQNQSLSDSASGLATDLRDEVYQMVGEGKAEGDIKAFLVERYGNFVLYDPPLNPSTSVLWFAPFLMITLALGLILFFSKKQKAK